MENILDYPTNEEERRLRYAGFWIRVVAQIIDSIAVAIINALLYKLIWGKTSFDGTDALLPFLLTITLYLIYYAGMESSSKQGTLGKMALNIQVGDRFGNRVSFANAAGRYFSKFISFIIFCIGFMMVGWDPKKQGLHDKFADTYVFYA